MLDFNSQDSKELALKTLREGRVELEGQFILGSNSTFFARISLDEMEMLAVYKPARGEQQLWDFPYRSLCRREVAAFVVSEALGWNLVPPTVYRRDAPLGVGSLQQFIEHDPNYYFFNFSIEDRQRLRPAAVFDLLVNNADRKGGHVIKDKLGHLWLIDHGVCFHPENKLRTVLWEFVGEAIPPGLLADIQRIIEELDVNGSLRSNLKGLLRKAEVQALQARARQIILHPYFPEPEKGRLPYPWPLV